MPQLLAPLITMLARLRLKRQLPLKDGALKDVFSMRFSVLKMIMAA